MQIRRKLSFLVVTALAGATLLQSPAVKADKTLSGLPTEDVYFTDIPVVLSVTRLAQPKSDAPAAITVIDRSTIEASGIREIPELMRLVPGFQVGHDYGDVLAPEQTPVTYLGYSDQFSRKMQVLVDGRSVYDPMYGGVRWSELGLLLDDIDRIEVIRGPNAASYGSNAFLGVINIITRDPTGYPATFWW
jgi:iron complex outermembrane receptor protein